MDGSVPSPHIGVSPCAALHFSPRGSGVLETVILFLVILVKYKSARPNIWNGHCLNLSRFRSPLLPGRLSWDSECALTIHVAKADLNYRPIYTPFRFVGGPRLLCVIKSRLFILIPSSHVNLILAKYIRYGIIRMKFI